MMKARSWCLESLVTGKIGLESDGLRGYPARMRPLALLALMLAAAPAGAETVCYYNYRAKVAETLSARCSGDQMIVDGSASKIYDVSCGVRNTFNLFSDLCAKPCASALKGIASYKRKGKIVVFGPALLALDSSNNSKWAFGEYKGSCYDLKESLYSKKSAGVEPITDDDLIKAAGDKD